MAGLSWLTILRKRENFRAAFENFEIDKVAGFGTDDVDRLLADAGIVRHRGKIEAVINNARRCFDIRDEFGSLAAYAWGYEPDPSTRPAGARSGGAHAASDQPRVGGDEQGPAPPRLVVRRADDGLLVHGGDGPRQRPSRRLCDPRAGGRGAARLQTTLGLRPCSWTRAWAQPRPRRRWRRQEARRSPCGRGTPTDRRAGRRKRPPRGIASRSRPARRRSRSRRGPRLGRSGSAAMVALRLRVVVWGSATRAGCGHLAVGAGPARGAMLSGESVDAIGRHGAPIRCVVYMVRALGRFEVSSRKRVRLALRSAPRWSPPPRSRFTFALTGPRMRGRAPSGASFLVFL